VRPARIFIISHDLSENAAGRAHVLWRLAQHLGIPATVAGLSSRGGVWAPIQEEAFLADCEVLDSRATLVRRLRTDVGPGDLLLSVKTWPESLGVGVDVARATGCALLADIDDPDHAALVGDWAGPLYRHAFRARMRFQGRSPNRFDELDDLAGELPHIVSNPALWHLYGRAPVVPHARDVPERCPPLPPSDTIDVAFVGTPRRHKGLGRLREAIATLATEGFTLVVTGDPPHNAKPWERWVGTTSLERGRSILAESQVVALPTLNRGYGRAQLPAKLIDAMALGRPIVAAYTAPIAWALDDAGVLVHEPSIESLTRGLRTLHSRERRTNLAQRAHARALARFSVPPTAETLAAAMALLPDH
jgi:glycosyltransferase involved in cell wall biosynthesis